VERLLLVRLSAIGDVLQCLPALADLRASRPDAEIRFLVEDRCAAVLRGHPHLDGVVVYEREALARDAARPWRWPAALARLWRLARELRRFRPDASVDLQGNLKGALLARLAGAPRRVGLARRHGARESSHRFATETVDLPPPPVHRSERARALLAAVGARPGAGTARVAGVEEAGTGAEAWIAAQGLGASGFAVLHPGTSGFGAMKRWPPERFAALARRLRDERGLPSVVTAGPGEERLADAVVAGSDGAARRGPATRSLAELGALLARARVVVAADTGPAHLAAVLGAPVLTLFGPKAPAIYAPRGPRSAVAWKQVWCSPCPLRRCADPACMTALRVDEAWPAVARLLDGGAAP
jgi:heptosyltransferase-1